MFHPFSKIREAADILQDFRKRFEDQHQSMPVVNVAIAGVCASKEEKALSIAKNFQLPFPLPQIVGNPEQCKEQLLDLQDQMGVEEIVFTDISNRFQDKVTSYALLADSLSLKDVSSEVEQMTAIVS